MKEVKWDGWDAFIFFFLGGLTGVLIGLVVAGISSPDEAACRIVTLPSSGAEYTARGNTPEGPNRGGYWIVNGKVVAFAMSEDDHPVKSLGCWTKEESGI